MSIIIISQKNNFIKKIHTKTSKLTWNISLDIFLVITWIMYGTVSFTSWFFMHRWKRKALLIDGLRFITLDARQMTQHTNFPALRANNFHGALPYLIALIVPSIISLDRIKGSGNPSRRLRLLNGNVISVTLVRHPRGILKVEISQSIFKFMYIIFFTIRCNILHSNSSYNNSL